MHLIFATNNQHKIEEVTSLIPPGFSVISLKEAGIDIDIPEPHQTLEENAAEKAKVIFQLTGKNCFSEDTGLEVYELNHEPGVHSARYAGDERDFSKNIDKLLSKLKSSTDRKARFRAVICLILDKQEYFFEGVCEGMIIEKQNGTGGFGYDSIFIPGGADKTFAQMTMTEKNIYSHRRKAFDKLVAFLKTKNNL
jgi:XTP/dITP diphosphohydrolase